jgi:phospholipid/cholesterol/gamma-HCH transport system substrate-binding protein
METKANYLAVGAFVLAVIAGLFGFVLWLGKGEIDREVDRYTVYFRGSVSGLTDSSTVRYRGVPVGAVSDIRIDPDNSEQVRVTIEVKRDTPIKEDSVASLELQGITGLVNVQLGGGGADSPRLEPKPGEELAVIAAAPSKLEALFEDLPLALARFTYMVERATFLLSDDNLAAISDTLTNFNALTGTLAASSTQFESLSNDVAVSAAEVRQTAEEINVLVRELRARVPTLVDNASATLVAGEGALNAVGASVDALTEETRLTLRAVRESARTLVLTAEKLNGMVDENRAALRDFSSEGLYELSQFLVEARALVDSLTRVSDRFESDPAGFLFGNAQAGYETR